MGPSNKPRKKEQSLFRQCLNCCTCQSKAKKSVSNFSIPEEVKNVKITPNESTNVTFVPSSSYATAATSTEATENLKIKKSVQEARKRLKQKMVLMVKPVVGIRKSGEMATARRGQDVWEGDTHLRILMEYQELQKAQEAASKIESKSKPKSESLKKIVKFRSKATEVHSETPAKIVPLQYESKKSTSDTKSLKSADGMSVELYNYVIDDKSDVSTENKNEVAHSKTLPQDQNDITVKCDVCGVSTNTNIDELAHHKHIMSFLHKDSPTNLEKDWSILPSQLPPEKDVQGTSKPIAGSQNAVPDAADKAKVVELLMDKSSFPCINTSGKK